MTPQLSRLIADLLTRLPIRQAQGIRDALGYAPALSLLSTPQLGALLSVARPREATLIKTSKEEGSP